MTPPDSRFAGYSKLPEPDLLFHQGGLHKHPLVGLIEYGPFSLKLGVPGRVRIAVVARQTDMGRVSGLIRELGQNAQARQATNYYPDFPGFQQVYRTPLIGPTDRTTIALSDTLDHYAKAGQKHELARELFQSLARLTLLRAEFDVVLLYLPHAWAACFEGENFNFHDYLKAFCAPSDTSVGLRGDWTPIEWAVERERKCPKAHCRFARSICGDGCIPDGLQSASMTIASDCHFAQRTRAVRPLRSADAGSCPPCGGLYRACYLGWWGRWESNPHSLRNGILSLARLRS